MYIGFGKLFPKSLIFLFSDTEPIIFTKVAHYSRLQKIVHCIKLLAKISEIALMSCNFEPISVFKYRVVYLYTHHLLDNTVMRYPTKTVLLARVLRSLLTIELSSWHLYCPLPTMEVSQCNYSWELCLLFSNYSPKLNDTYSQMKALKCKTLCAELAMHALCTVYRL